MTIGGVSLSSSVQSSLSALANTAQLLKTQQQQLATGKSVNSPSDNPTAYYAAQSLLQQASDLSNVKDNLSTSLTTVNATTDAISSVTNVVQQLQGITTQALSTTDPTQRANLASQYNALLPQLDGLVNDSNFNGTNLLNGSGNNLTVNFNASGTSQLIVQGTDATAAGLGIAQAQNNFATNADITTANTQLSNALSQLSTAASNFGGNASIIETNQDFASNQINSLETAADNLTGGDIDEAAANLLALQAQNQLGTVSLNISSQLSQYTLKLFG